MYSYSTKILPLLLGSLIILLSGMGCDRANKQNQEASQPAETPVSPTPQPKPFDEMATDYERPERVIWQQPELVVELLGNLEGKTVADIGAGTGYFAFRIASNGADVIAIDIDPQAIAWMDAQRLKYPASVQQRFVTRRAEKNDPRLAPGEVDIVLMVNTYIYLEDRISYFRNLRSGIRPGGKVVIIDFKKKSTPIGPDLEDRVPINRVEQELGAAGYRMLSIDDTTLDYQYIVVAAR